MGSGEHEVGTVRKRCDYFILFALFSENGRQLRFKRSVALSLGEIRHLRDRRAAGRKDG